MSRPFSRAERCLSWVVCALLVQERRRTYVRPLPLSDVAAGRRPLLVLEEAQEIVEPEEQGELHECCVCYEPRARAPRSHCLRCGARAPVCGPCLQAWSRSSGRPRRCVICRSGDSTAVAPRRPLADDEQYLTLFFVVYTFLQYAYVIWFLRTFVTTVQPYLF